MTPSGRCSMPRRMGSSWPTRRVRSSWPTGRSSNCSATGEATCSVVRSTTCCPNHYARCIGHTARAIGPSRESERWAQGCTCSGADPTAGVSRRDQPEPHQDRRRPPDRGRHTRYHRTDESRSGGAGGTRHPGCDPRWRVDLRCRHAAIHLRQRGRVRPGRVQQRRAPADDHAAHRTRLHRTEAESAPRAPRAW